MLLGFVLSGCAGSKPEGVSNTQTYNEETINWLEYKNEEFKISFQFPATWELNTPEGNYGRDSEEREGYISVKVIRFDDISQGDVICYVLCPEFIDQ